jgi:hypothetical protein
MQPSGRNRKMINGSGDIRLADIAVVKMRGTDIPEPGSQEHELIFAAWEVYRYIRARAQRGGKESIRFGRDGWEWEGEIRQVCREIWQANASPLPLAGTDHEDGRRAIQNWLLTTANLGVITPGNEELHVRKATVAARSSRWWIAQEFTGAPEGMKLPETSSLQVDDLPAPLSPSSVPDAKTQEPKDWWCPYFRNCNVEAPFNERELHMHLSKVHGFRVGNGLHDIAMREAEELRGERLGSGYVQPEEEKEEFPPPRRAGVLKSLVPEPKIELPQQTIPLPPVPPAQSLPPGTVFAAQVTVFMQQVIELEQENVRLRRENRRLQELLDSAPRPVRLEDSEIKRIAWQVSGMLKSGDGNS